MKTIFFRLLGGLGGALQSYDIHILLHFHGGLQMAHVGVSRCSPSQSLTLQDLLSCSKTGGAGASKPGPWN